MEKNFGEVLRELREKRGLTVNQLGIYSEVSPALISKLENGKRGIPKPDTIKKIAKGLKIPYEELMVLAGHVPEERDAVDKLNEYLDLELTDDEIMERMTFKVDNLTLSEEDVREFIAYIRGKRLMNAGQQGGAIPPKS